jgi:hypothetical protein
MPTGSGQQSADERQPRLDGTWRQQRDGRVERLVVVRDDLALEPRLDGQQRSWEQRDW